MSKEGIQASQQDNHQPASAAKSAAQEKTPSPASSYLPAPGLSISGASSADDIPLTRDNILYLQRTIGNRAVVQLLQRKGKLSQPGDAYEREADRVADQVMRMPDQANDDEKRKRPEEEATVQAKEEAGQAPEITPKVESEITNLQSGGEPLSETVRADFEPRFGQDFSDVRVHKGSQAAETARALNARAYTTGRDIAFGAGEYKPETDEGKKLIAHELTHVVQQNSSIKNKEIQSSSIATTVFSNHQLAQRQESPGPTTPAKDSNATPAKTLIVEDSEGASQPGQMTKSQFLAVARDEVCRSVGEVLASVGRSTDDCPYIGVLFNFLGRRDAKYINQTLAGFAPEASNSTSAGSLIPIITRRARQSAEEWVKSGEIGEMPEGVPTTLFGSALSGLSSGIGNVFLKARDGGARETDDPQAIQARLGDGRQLDSGVNSRMASVFGEDFSQVRVHEDGNAAGLSSELNARALTVGEHVAFGAGEYRPGTLIGDALIAHELAHVAQQKGGKGRGEIRPKSESDNNMLETEADTSAVNAVVALWGGAKTKMMNVGVNALPQLKSGLRLQRCSKPATLEKDPKVIALKKEMQDLIDDAVWDRKKGIRTRVYPKESAAGIQRAKERKAGTRPDLTGLGKLTTITSFVGAIKSLQGRWGPMSVDDRVQAIGDAANAELFKVGVPKFLGLRKEKMDFQGYFRRRPWDFTISEDLVSSSVLNDADAAELSNTVLHEARHAEQQFLAARYAAGPPANMKAPAIAAEQRILEDPIANAAVDAKFNATTDPQVAALGKDMYKATVTEGDVNQKISDDDYMKEMADARTEATTSLAALNSSATASAVADATAKRDALKAAIAEVERRYTLYRNIPYESDAHEVGDTAEQAFKGWP